MFNEIKSCKYRLPCGWCELRKIECTINSHNPLVPILDSNENVISENTLRCKVLDSELASQVFNLAGLNNWCTLNVNYSVFKRGEEKIGIQDIEGLGMFLEFEEYPSIESLSEQEKIDKLCGTINYMGINHTGDYSCKKVYMKFKKDNSIK